MGGVDGADVGGAGIDASETHSGLLPHVLGFIRALRVAGVATDPTGAIDLCRGLARIDMTRPEDVRATARTTLVTRREDLRVFDEVFRAYWYRQIRPQPTHAADSHGDDGGPDPRAAPGTERRGDELGEGREQAGGYSPDERIALMDFATLSESEVEQARRLLQTFIAEFASLRSRRHVAGRLGRLPDFRRLMRRTASRGADTAEWFYRQRKLRKLRLMLLCDVSGSMARYTRFLLEFMFALRSALPATEVAVFSTRLTVITDALASSTVDKALGQVASQAGDWGGGTDIGGCLRSFNIRYARQLLRSDSVVVILSDGWDRGDARVMRDEIAHLSRRARHIVWLNPLLGNPEYEPLTRGMRTALPHLDYFLPAHNLESLSRVARTLQAIWR